MIYQTQSKSGWIGLDQEFIGLIQNIPYSVGLVSVFIFAEHDIISS